MVDPHCHSLRRDARRSDRLGTQFTRIVWGKLAEECILPDTQALAAALA